LATRPSIGVPGKNQILPPPGRHFSSPSSPMLGTPEKALIATCSGGIAAASSCEI
jgi:hypothetical protein